jgi:hypothetical protein
MDGESRSERVSVPPRRSDPVKLALNGLDGLDGVGLDELRAGSKDDLRTAGMKGVGMAVEMSGAEDVRVRG